MLSIFVGHLAEAGGAVVRGVCKKPPFVGKKECMGTNNEEPWMSEQQPFEPRRSISRYLTEEGALPICEQCNSSGYSKPINIRWSENGSIGFEVSQMWAHKPFGESDCRWVFLCEECCWKVQVEGVTGEEDWFASQDVYGIHPDCPQCQVGSKT